MPLTNNPVDAQAVSESFRRVWWGIGFAYRRHMNQAGRPATLIRPTPITQVQKSVGRFVPGRGIIIVPGTTIPRRPTECLTASSSPTIRMAFIVQLWAGHRNARIPPAAA